MTAVAIIFGVADVGLLIWNLRLQRENRVLSRLLRHSTAGG